MSMPAENDSPAPLTTTARTSSGSPSPIAASACHILGVWLLRSLGLVQRDGEYGAGVRDLQAGSGQGLVVGEAHGRKPRAVRRVGSGQARDTRSA